MSNKIEPVFKVTVSVSMTEIIEDVIQFDENDYGDANAYIENDAIQKAVMDKAANQVVRLFDRNVLNGIQSLTQAEIKDQISKKIPALIDDALSGPASKFPELTLSELLEKEIHKQFEFRENGSTAPSAQTKLGTLVEQKVDAAMRNVEKRLREVVAEVVMEKMRETAEGMVNSTKAA